MSDAHPPPEPKETSTPEPSGLERAEVFADPSLAGTVFCRSYTRRVDEWLQAIWTDNIGEVPGIALVALGGYGRRALSPHSDLDLMLLHRRTDPEHLETLAEALWYPIWDEGLKLGHSVRSVREAVSLATDDLETATSLLSMRCIAGDPSVVRSLAGQSERLWRKNARKWLPDLAEQSVGRGRDAGEVAFLLEPDLKNSRGGLRDVHALQWAEAAGVDLLEQESSGLRDAHETLLAARVELHRTANRAGDVLRLEEQDAVAEALSLPDATALMTSISQAGRTIAWIADDVFTRSSGLSDQWYRRITRRQKVVAPALTLAGGALHVGAGAPVDDPATILQVAVTAARHDVRIDRRSLDRLVEQRRATPRPWTDDIRSLFVELLQEGREAIPVIEALDQMGVMTDLIPQWEPTRAKPQRNAYHTYTVDRHLLEAASNASYLTEMVDRPDLLLIGALMHDIGKGLPGDHTDVGMMLMKDIGPQMGFSDADTAILISMIQHHLLLPDVATRRDIEDDDTIEFVAAQVGSAEVLYLLGALTEADSLATGPSAWSRWKAHLVRDLVGRTEAWLLGNRGASRSGLSPEDAAMFQKDAPIIDADGDQLIALLPDQVGLFSKVAGALALAGLDIREASIVSRDGVALQRYAVDSVVEREPDWERAEALITEALGGELDIAGQLTERVKTWLPRRTSSPVPVVDRSVSFDTTTSSWATIVEVGAPDLLGLLHVVTAALASQGLDIGQARVQSLGDHVVDSFYVTKADGGKIVEPARLEEIQTAVLAAVADLETERATTGMSS